MCWKNANKIYTGKKNEPKQTQGKDLLLLGQLWGAQSWGWNYKFEPICRRERARQNIGRRVVSSDGHIERWTIGEWVDHHNSRDGGERWSCKKNLYVSACWFLTHVIFFRFLAYGAAVMNKVDFYLFIWSRWERLTPFYQFLGLGFLKWF